MVYQTHGIGFIKPYTVLEASADQQDAADQQQTQMSGILPEI